jgi:hypothetical protein
MNKQWLLSAAAVAAMSGACFAGSDDVMKFYVGGFGGYSAQTASVDFTNRTDIADGTYDLGHDGVQYGGFLGLGFMVSDCLCVGVEGFGFGGKVTAKFPATTTVSESLSVNDGFGAAACFGYKMEHAMPFVRLGWVNSKWKISNGIDAEAVNNKSKRLNGFSWDYNLYGKWAGTLGEGGDLYNFETTTHLAMAKLHVKFAF